MNTVAERFDPRSNALNLIRLCLAALVIVSHAIPIGGLGDEPHLGDSSLGLLAVGGFFVISGYLITQSRASMGFFPYLWRRALRILPAYWVVLIFTAFVAAAVVGLSRGGWSADAAAHYVLSNADMWHGDAIVGQTLAGSPFPEAWNGSLWTLRYEVWCYLFIAVAYFVPLVRRNKWITLAIYIVLAILSLIVLGNGIHSGIAYHLALLVPFFFAGATLFHFADLVPVRWQLAVASAVIVVVLCFLGLGRSLSGIPIAYLMFWIGISAPEWAKRLGRTNDYSYGMYLYGFPVQQLLVVVGLNELGAPLYVIACILATIPFAVASWWAIERPAMKLKRLVKTRPRAKLPADRARLSA